MGTIWSSEPQASPQATPLEEDDADKSHGERGEERQKVLEEFQKELSKKQELRHQALARISDRINNLNELAEEERNKRVEAEGKLQSMTEALSSDEDKAQLAQKLKESEELIKKQEKEIGALKQKCLRVDELEKLVDALKDVSKFGRQIQKLKEQQVESLKKKLAAIQTTRAEYEDEVMKIKKLRDLYDERSKAISKEHQYELEKERNKTIVAETKLNIQEKEVKDLQEKNAELVEVVGKLDKTVIDTRQEISDVRIQLATKCEELYDATSQLEAINSLLSQVIMGPEVDFDRLVRLLEDNHDLINDLTVKGEINDLASLLVDVAGQAEGKDQSVFKPEQQDIADNLRKVWRVLAELLSHHSEGTVKAVDGVPESCYKSVNTPSGPKLVISTSQTFLKLKDLILEKNSLVKEVSRLKILNGHMEERLEQHEKRLELVSAELHKTWSVVSKLKDQHKLLHSHEKILRYELKHKRHVLNELKKELEVCREQWEEAKAKNNQTEKDWETLRREFALRKKEKLVSDGFTREIVEDESPLSGELSDSTEEDDIIHSKCTTQVDNISPIEEDPIHPLSSETRGYEGLTQNFSSLELADDEGSTNQNPSPSAKQTPPSDKERQYEEAIRQVSASAKLKTPQALHQNRSLSPVLEEGCAEGAATPPTAKPSTSGEPTKKLSAEELLSRREERLSRLESGCKLLFSQMNSTSIRSDMISNRLEELHEHYGGEDARQTDAAINNQPSTSQPHHPA